MLREGTDAAPEPKRRRRDEEEEATGKRAPPDMPDEGGAKKRSRGARAAAVDALPHWLCYRYGVGWSQKFHPSHRLMASIPVVYCANCGRWSGSEAVVRLAEPCGGPLTADDHGYKSRLRLLDGGLHPLTRQPLLTGPIPLHRGRM